MLTELERVEIRESQRRFDLGVPLTDEELALAGFLVGPPAKKEAPRPELPALRDLEEDSFAPTDAVVDAAVEDTDYNARYAHYLKYQALAALAAFDEGWEALEELALRAYVSARRRENADYRGDDPHKAFALRLRAQAAEDFLGFIHAVVSEAVNAPKPVSTNEM